MALLLSFFLRQKREKLFLFCIASSQNKNLANGAKNNKIGKNILREKRGGCTILVVKVTSVLSRKNIKEIQFSEQVCWYIYII